MTAVGEQLKDPMKKLSNGQPEGQNDQRGKIKSDFPKHTLEEALQVPTALAQKNGSQPLPPTETAIAMGVSPGSSDFRTILSSSFKYGLTSGSFNADRISIEELGISIVEPKSNEERQRAMVSAALSPPTFRSIYNYFRGKKLPEDAFFQSTIVREFQVPREHAEKCVQVFNANVDRVGLVRNVSTGRWLGSEAEPMATSAPTRADAPNAPDEIESPSVAAPSGSHPPAEKKPASAIFIGHGKNKTPLGQLEQILSKYKIPFKVATEEANSFRPISQKVADVMKECGAAILIFTADEEITDGNGQKTWRPSENVVYELGAASALHGNRIIIFKEASVVFPSNFRDIGHISFEKDQLAAKTNELFTELIKFELIKISVGG
jgi:predicted nucleotide-binding protein